MANRRRPGYRTASGLVYEILCLSEGLGDDPLRLSVAEERERLWLLLKAFVRWHLSVTRGIKRHACPGEENYRRIRKRLGMLVKAATTESLGPDREFFWIRYELYRYLLDNLGECRPGRAERTGRS